MRNLTVAELASQVRQKESAFKAIADALGKKHPVTAMMGELAWGRYEAESSVSSPHARLRPLLMAHGYLDGCFHILNLWTRDNDRDAQKLMHKHWYERSA